MIPRPPPLPHIMRRHPLLILVSLPPHLIDPQNLCQTRQRHIKTTGLALDTPSALWPRRGEETLSHKLELAILFDAASRAVGGGRGDKVVVFDGAVAEGCFRGGGGGDEGVWRGGGEVVVLEETGRRGERAIEDEERGGHAGLQPGEAPGNQHVDVDGPRRIFFSFFCKVIYIFTPPFGKSNFTESTGHLGKIVLSRV
jgi:hypothetical protein